MKKETQFPIVKDLFAPREKNESLFKVSDSVKLRGQPDSPNLIVRSILEINHSFCQDKEYEYKVYCDYWNSKKECFIRQDFNEKQLEIAPQKE